MNKLTREERIRIKAQEVIDLLKEYLPEYKEAFDSYNPDTEYHLDICEEGDEAIMGEFSFLLWDKNETYHLDIRDVSILKIKSSNPVEVIEIAKYIDHEVMKHKTFENPWTWDDAIVEIKRQMEENKHDN